MINSILVVCTGNVCRSPMAAALLEHRLSEQGSAVTVASAGVGALVGHPPAEPAIELMEERGLDISGHRGRQIDPEMARSHDLILVMERDQQRVIERWWPEIRGRVHRLAESQQEDIPDPYRRPREAFEQSLASIDAGVENWVCRLGG